jgi:hypothetical protein
MPLRHSYEAMVVAQATRNPFEYERDRLQRRIEKMKDYDKTLPGDVADRFDLMKEGLRRLLASGASTPEEAVSLFARITRLARSGTRLEVETIKVWPDDQPKVRPASEFFVNERIDLLVREAETFRSDYRNEKPRNVFLGLKKSFILGDPGPKIPDNPKAESKGLVLEFETLDCAIVSQLLIVIGCGVVSSLVLAAQNRRTH